MANSSRKVCRYLEIWIFVCDTVYRLALKGGALKV